MEVQIGFSHGTHNDFDTLLNTWPVQDFVRVAETWAGAGYLKRVENDAFGLAGARISGFVKSMF